MRITARVKKVMDLQSGKSAKGEWKKQSVLVTQTENNFKDELLLPDSYFTMNNPYEQIDIIVNSLEQLSKIEFSEVFQESQDKILENKVLLLEHYKKIMEPDKQFIES